MGSFLHPVGPQPTGVYWVRRGVLIAAVLVVVTVVGVVFNQPGTSQTAAPVSASPVASSSPSVLVSQSPTASASASPSASPSPTGPLACDSTNTELGLSGYQRVKADSKQPFKLSVTNSGDATCVLDLKASNFVLTITSGSDRIWSTDDCTKWVPSKKTKLAAGKAHEFTITWTVKRSSAGCKLAKATLGAGTYVAEAAFDKDATARQVFQVSAA